MPAASFAVVIAVCKAVRAVFRLVLSVANVVCSVVKIVVASVSCWEVRLSKVVR
jgi:hypothetical protein